MQTGGGGSTSDQKLWYIEVFGGVAMLTFVVAGIVEKDGRVLLAQRPEGKSHALLWEFPGGKVEKGETPEGALVRELREELDLTVSVGTCFARRSLESPQGILVIDYFHAAPVAGRARPIECRAVAWVQPEEMTDYPLSPLDSGVARAYIADRLSRLSGPT